MSDLFDQEEVKEQPAEQTTAVLVFAEEEKPVVSRYDMEQRVLEIVAVCKNASIINDDASNDYARQVGKNANLIAKAIEAKRKELNENPKKEIDANNAVAKKLMAPIEAEVEKIRLAVSTYELEKEKKRLAELKKIEDEKRAKEEAERKDRERVNNIKRSIFETKSKAFTQIDGIEGQKALDEFVTKLKGWKPKPEFYAEFMGELEAVLKEIDAKIEARKVIIADIEKAKAEAERLKGVAKKQAEKELELKKQKLELQKAKEKADKEKQEAEEKAAESRATQDLSIYLATLGVKDVEKSTSEVIQLYGKAVTALENKPKIVEKINAERIAAYNSKNLKADKMKNQRTEYKFEVLDESLLPREYLSVDETKIRKAIIEKREALEEDINSFQIAGVRIYPEVKTILK